MGVYKPLKGADGAFLKNPDGSLRMAPTRRDPTTEEVRSVMRQQHILQTRQQMQRSGEQRPYLAPAPAAPAPASPPPTAEQMAASQTPLPQAAPVAQHQAPPISYDTLAKTYRTPVEVFESNTPLSEAQIAEAFEKGKVPNPLKPAPKPKKTRKAGKQKNLPRRKCAWEECHEGPGGLQKVFQPYRKFKKYCCDECRDAARKKKAKDKYHAKKKAAANA